MMKKRISFTSQKRGKRLRLLAVSIIAIFIFRDALAVEPNQMTEWF